ncbi:hypothetical protein [Galactobacter caseinivorans]|nr:hypothetical protein [Galactobacter caseinivorans]
MELSDAASGAHAAEPAKPTDARAVAPAGWRRAAVVLLCLALAGSVLGFFGLLLVVGQLVIPGWVVGGVLLLAALILLVVDGVKRRGPSRAEGGSGRSRLPWTVKALAVLVVAASGFGAASDIGGVRYHVLSPAGGDGCRVVVREASFLFSGSGSAYAVGPSGLGWKASSWTADDGYQLVAGGDYELTWGPDGGLLTFRDTSDPVWPSLHEVGC